MAETIKNNKFSASVGAGMKSLFSAGGRTYYVLEHKLNSAKHKAGEKQEIIIDYIELGRGPKCQVQFDETQASVSNQHAAILREEGNWKLRHLSRTNETLLNGRPIKNEWYLQSGDEIQLSIGGPKLGFIVPSQNSVGSIGLSRRLSLFRQQALRPYKTAITLLSLFFIVLAGGGGFWGYRLWNENQDLAKQLDDQVKLIANIDANILNQKKQNQAQIDSIKRQANNEIEAAERRIRKSIQVGNTGGYALGNGALSNEQLQQCMNDVYYLFAYKVEVILSDGRVATIPEFGWSGTAFLLDDHRLVTARHCVFGWQYPADDPKSLAVSRAENAGARVKAYFVALSQNGDKFELTSDNFKNNGSFGSYDTGKVDENGDAIILNLGESNNADWSFARVNKKGFLTAGDELSTRLPANTPLVIIGYPRSIGVNFETAEVTPQCNNLTTSQNGLSDDGTIRVTNSVDHGNSGGPALLSNDGKVLVVGVASRIDEKSEKYAYYVPINNVR